MREIVLLILFFVWAVGTLCWLPPYLLITHQLFQRLERNHPEIFRELGEPRVGPRAKMKSTFKGFKFLLKFEVGELEDDIVFLEKLKLWKILINVFKILFIVALTFIITLLTFMIDEVFL